MRKIASLGIFLVFACPVHAELEAFDVVVYGSSPAAIAMVSHDFSCFLKGSLFDPCPFVVKYNAKRTKAKQGDRIHE